MVDVLRGGIGSWWQRRAETHRAQAAAAQAAREDAEIKRQATLVKEQLYALRIPQIEVFPGSLDEYQNLKGGERFQVIDVQRKWNFIWGDPHKQWKELTGHDHYYNEMLARAVDLGATAVIRWDDVNYSLQRGISVRPAVDPGQS